MKKHYFEAVVLTIIYLVLAFAFREEFHIDKGIADVLTYPATLCVEPIVNRDFSLERINLGLFGLYFLWSFNCVYLNVIKGAINYVKSNRTSLFR